MALKDFMKEFLSQDEEGSATVWSLFWTLVFLFLAGISIDASNAYRFKSALQMTADASSVGRDPELHERGTPMSELHRRQYRPGPGSYRGTEVAPRCSRPLNMGTVAQRNRCSGRQRRIRPLGRLGVYGRLATPIDASACARRSGPIEQQQPAADAAAGQVRHDQQLGRGRHLGRAGLFRPLLRRQRRRHDGGWHTCRSRRTTSSGDDLCLHGDERVDINNNNDLRAQF